MLDSRALPDRLVQLVFFVYPKKTIVDQATGHTVEGVVPELILRSRDNLEKHIRLNIGMTTNANTVPPGLPLAVANLREGVGWPVAGYQQLYDVEQQMNDDVSLILFSLGTSKYLNSDIIDRNTGKGYAIFQTLIDSLDIIPLPQPPGDQSSKIHQYFERVRRYQQACHATGGRQATVGLLTYRRLPLSPEDLITDRIFGVWEPRHPKPIESIAVLNLVTNFLRAPWFQRAAGVGESHQSAEPPAEDPGINLFGQVGGNPTLPGHILYASDSDNEGNDPGIPDFLSTVDGLEEMVLQQQGQAGANAGEQVGES
ncbi:hypothetical protein MMC17_007187 [Xylographa soralifera]|nr:hypothetical protein [Xylographa soralifera]